MNCRQLAIVSFLIWQMAARADSPMPSVDSLLSEARAYAQTGRLGDAERDYQSAMREAEKIGSRNPQLLDALAAAAEFFEQQGKLTESEKLYRRQLDLSRSLNPTDNLQTAHCMRQVARVCVSQGNYTEGTSILREAVDMCERVSDRCTSRNDMNWSKDRLALADCLDQLAQACNLAAPGGAEAKQAQERALGIRSHPSGR